MNNRKLNLPYHMSLNQPDTKYAEENVNKRKVIWITIIHLD